MWHAVGPMLARDFTVVAADLPGYGRSTPVVSGGKREMAEVLVAMLGRLGFEHFSVAGHDRGGRCAYRMALDHPDLVERLAVLDIVPTAEMWRRADMEFGLVDWHWFFLAQPEPFPERLIASAPDAGLTSSRRGGAGPTTSAAAQSTVATSSLKSSRTR